MLALIPLVGLFALFFMWNGFFPGRDRRELALYAGITWGVLVVFSTEILGLVHAVTRMNVLVFWLVMLLAIAGLIFKKRANAFKFAYYKPAGWLEWGLLAGILVYAAITLFVALMSPPNTNDALQYHMSRVMHWIVNRSVSFYPTAVERQLWMPPFAGYSILHFQLLAGTDRFANLVQWLAYSGSILAAGLIASRLRVNSRGQLFAALFLATMPMAVLQASSAQTDLVAGFWSMCAIYFALNESQKFVFEKQKNISIDSLFLSLAVALGALTKGTVYPVILPILLYLLVVMLWKRLWKAMIFLALLGVLATVLLNGIFWSRNISVYGSPLGPATGYGVTTFTPLAVFSSALKNGAMQSAFEIGPGNKVLYLSVLKIHEWLGLDVSDPRTTMGDYAIRFSYHEDFSGNKWHFLFWFGAGVFSIIYFIIQFRKRRAQGAGNSSDASYSFYLPLYYAIFTLTSYVFISALFKWQDTNSRLLLPWLLSTAPLAAWVFEKIRWPALKAGLSIFLFFTSLVYLLANPSRPILPLGRNESILVARRTQTLFNNSPEVANDYISVLVTARDLKCPSVGLSLDSKDPEYLVWAILSPSGQDLTEVQHLLLAEESRQFANPDFKPCIIICSVCSPAEKMGYEQVYNRGSLQLYVNPEWEKAREQAE